VVPTIAPHEKFLVTISPIRYVRRPKVFKNCRATEEEGKVKDAHHHVPKLFNVVIRFLLITVVTRQICHFNTRHSLQKCVEQNLWKEKSFRVERCGLFAVPIQ